MPSKTHHKASPRRPEKRRSAYQRMQDAPPKAPAVPHPMRDASEAVAATIAPPERQPMSPTGNDVAHSTQDALDTLRGNEHVGIEDAEVIDLTDEELEFALRNEPHDRSPSWPTDSDIDRWAEESDWDEALDADMAVLLLAPPEPR